MSPRPDVSKQRIAQITQAAIVVFSQKGFDGATMSDIAAEAGINKATIYLYFDSKEALIRSIAEYLFDREIADLRAAYESEGTAVTRLNTFYETLTAGTPEVSPLMPVIFEFYALGQRNEKVRAILEAFIEQSKTLLQSIISDGIAAGEFAPVDAEKTARTLLALLDGVSIQWAYDKNMDVNAQIQFGVQLVLQGIMAS